MTTAELESKPAMRNVRLRSTAICCMTIVVLFIVNLPVANVSRIATTSNTADAKRYAIVIDAGSSGSRVYVYEWPSTSNGRSLLSLKQKTDENGKLVTMKTEPGLSSFRSTPQRAYSSLVPLLKLAASHIPSELHPTTNIYVLGTAGLRLVPARERNAILAAVFSRIRAQYRFNIQADHVRVISGQMEGVFGWIAVNYALSRLSRSSDGNQLETHGFIEMGGASEQIAYEVKNEVLPAEVGMDIQLCPPSATACLNYHLYVTTFLGFGANSAYQKYIQKLANQARSQTKSPVSVVEDPCQPRNMAVAVKASGSQVEVLAAGEEALPAGTNIELKGTGQFAACRKSLLPLLEASQEEYHSLGGAYQPRLPLSRSFYGLSEYWYCMEDILGIGGRYQYQRYVQANQKFCGMAWADIKKEKEIDKKYPKADSNRLRRQCFKAAWLAAVLHDGHHFPEKFDHFQSVSEIDHSEVQWTLGALVYNLHRPSSDSSGGMLNLPSYSTLPYKLLLLAAFVSFLVAFRSSCRKRLSQFFYG
ncbi:ectonucleoside triphosphate diphosphohydrolase 7-like isoform X1 [Sycon ciliatum]|uniref:ectonucleoside triphosphate diphosphohydrolase 7-like isoform X1 n=1 Tax=Sycon ciliatum TaxID=27933 RepID=UPI0031F62203